MATPPQQALVQRCIDGQPRAQRELYECFAPKMMGVCMRYAKSPARAEDMLQEGFIKVFQKLEKYQDKGSLEGWIRRIMINTAIDTLRREKHMLQQLEINEAIAEQVNESVLDELEADFLMDRIQELPTGYRLVFNLYAIEGYSHAEIGEQLHITESTSRSQYTRARAMLKKRICEAYMETNTLRDAI